MKQDVGRMNYFPPLEGWRIRYGGFDGVVKHKKNLTDFENP